MTVLAIAALLTACSSPTAPGGPVTKVIGEDGGTISAPDASGAVYSLNFPPGALDEDVTIELVPLVPQGEQIVAFAVRPAGLVLRLPADLEVTLPDAIPVPDMAAFYLGGEELPVYLETQVDGSVISATLRFFDVPVDGWMGLPPSAGPSAQGWPSMGPAQNETDPNVAATRADCQKRLASTQHTYDLFVASENFESAVRIAINGGTTAALCGDDEAFDDFVAQIRPAACARYEELVLNAQVIAADDYDIFTELISPIQAWSATLQNLGVSCETSVGPKQVIASKLSQFITFYAGKLEDLPNEYEPLLDEARKVIALRGQASLLGLPEVEQQLTNEVAHPILDLLRGASYDECLASSDHYYLYSLIHAPFSSKRVPITPITPASLRPDLEDSHAAFDDADLANDIQLCASRLTVEVWADPDVPEEVTDSRVEFEPPPSPGQDQLAQETDGPVEGHLVLRGPIEQLRCGEGRSLVDHELVVRFAGQEVHRLQSLDSNPEVDVEAALTAAGLDPTGINAVDLVVRRESDACDGLYGDPDYLLFTTEYTADPAPKANAVSAAPASLVAETETSVTFTIDWSDPGENVEAMHVEYQLGDAVVRVDVDLETATDATGFDGGQGGGTYVATHYVFCSEEEDGPLYARFVLEDEYGQQSSQGEVAIPVSFAGCAEVRSPSGRNEVMPSPAATVFGGPT